MIRLYLICATCILVASGSPFKVLSQGISEKNELFSLYKENFTINILNPFKGVVVNREGQKVYLKYIYFNNGKFYTPESPTFFLDTTLGGFQSDTILLFGIDYEEVSELRINLALSDHKKYKKRLGYSYALMLFGLISLATINEKADSTPVFLLKLSPSILSLAYHYDLVYRRRRIDLSKYSYQKF